MTKCIEYAYPTSINAEAFGMGKMGCYTVKLIDGTKPGKTIAAFLTIEEAEWYADTMPEPWPWDTLTK
jgi:hypothetical protein